jgi:uncharacterized cupredoxin-like copper-binding protein
MGIGKGTARTRLVRKMANGLVGAGILILAGCTGGTPDVAVEMREFAFDPSQIDVQAGQKSTLVLRNVGNMEHKLSIPQLRLEAPVVAPGQTVRFEVATPPGSYKIVCAMPSHDEAGMTGEIRSVRRR